MPKLPFALFSLLAALTATSAHAMSVDARAHLLGGFTPRAEDLRDADVQRVMASPAWQQAAAHGSLAAVLKGGNTLFTPESRAAMNKFFAANLGPAREETRGLLYFFGGPDVLYPNLLFPQLERTLQVGLETPGRLPSPEELLDHGQLAGKMADIANAYRDIMRMSYYITSYMAKDLQAFGTSTMISVGLVANGFRVDAVETVALDDSGKVQAAGAGNGVRIRYTKKDGVAAEITYLRMNLSNESLRSNPAFVRFLNANSFETAYYKAASFVSSNRNFSTLNEMVLGKVNHVVQNDDGIPFRAIRESADRWEASFFGVYSKPASIFQTGVQKDLQAAYDAAICESGNDEARALYGKLWGATCRARGDQGFASLRWVSFLPFRYGYSAISGPRVTPNRNQLGNLMIFDRR